jgi:type VI secretion system Hcp family effector
MYMKFSDLEAGSTAAGHEKEVEVLSWSHSFSQATSPTRSSSGSASVEHAKHHNFSITKYLDVATHSLLRHHWIGKQYKTVVMTCYRASGEDKGQGVPYLKVTMEHVLVSNYSLSGGGGDLPVENLSLDYGIIEYNYIDQKQDTGQSDSNKPAKYSLETRALG